MMDPPLSNLPSTQATQILVVEDEQVIAINLRESLESLGYGVPALAATGAAAIAKATELRPDLVLMDIRLKGEMDGIQAAEQIWQTLQIPVIYVTGHSDQSTLERAKVTAPFGYILKPIGEKELYIAIETALQRCAREQLLLAVFRSMGDGVVVADAQRRVKFLNSMAEQLTGWSQEEARNQALADVLRIVEQPTQTPVLDRWIDTVLTTSTPIYLEDPFLLISKQGIEIPIADSITSLQDSRGNVTGIVIVFRDVTQRLLAAERDLAVERAKQLEVQMAELQRLNDLKEDFLATVSHELRTPLSNIQLATRMLTIILDQFGILAQESEAGSVALGRYINILKEQSDQELRLVNDLLDMQRLNAEAYPLDLSVVQLQDWIPHLLEPFVARMQMNQQRLHIDLPTDLPAIQTDTHVLTRIVSELMNNACKYTPPGCEITVTMHIVNPDDRPVDLPYVAIAISNSGSEIPAAELDRVFDAFYRIPQTDRWAKGGTGLGLALVKKFVGYLGGSVQVASAAAQTCFTVYLPLCPLVEEV
ncbi:response regulator [Pantanalinema rosaneae CENA516]|uniref:hybrid sensor histidine kinase/response regulator n=1 Tax=Pantanalinema rosaneae TaxID=1620701 RepID=UPI003D6E227C